MDLPTAVPASIVEALDDVVFATDAEGRLPCLNLAWTALTGHLVEDSLGTPLAGYLEHLPGSGETRCVTAYGGVRWVQVRARSGARAAVAARSPTSPNGAATARAWPRPRRASAARSTTPP